MKDLMNKRKTIVTCVVVYECFSKKTTYRGVAYNLIYFTNTILMFDKIQLI